MRQRILVMAAIALLLIAAILVLAKTETGSVQLALVPFPNMSWVYEYELETQIMPRGSIPRQVRQVDAEFTFKGRATRGGRVFQNQLAFTLPRVIIDGREQRVDTLPRIHFENQRDKQGRPLVNGFADLYPLELLNTALFFPFLTGQRTDAGDQWQEQFRVVLPWEQAQMIVILNTRMERITAGREAVLAYELHGETLYEIDGDQNPRTPLDKEKAVLRLEGQCLFDPAAVLPVTQHQEMTLEAFNFERLRSAAPDMDPGFARTASIHSTMELSVLQRGSLFTSSKTPTPEPGFLESLEDLE